MSDRSLRDQERAARLGCREAEVGLATELLRNGRWDELAAQLQTCIAARRRSGEVAVRFQRAADGEHEAVVRAPSDEVGATWTRLSWSDAMGELERLLGSSGADESTVMDPDEAVTLTRWVDAHLGPLTDARRSRIPEWEVVSPGNVRRQGASFVTTIVLCVDDGALEFEANDGALQCVVDGQRRSLLQLGRREFNFGQHWRTPGVQEVDYALTIPTRMIEGFLSAVLPEYLGDVSNQPPEDDLPFESVLRTAGWPAASVIVASPHLASAVMEHFAADLLMAWAGWNPAERVAYLANTAEAIFEAGGVRLSGKARSTVPPAPGLRFAFQDF